MSLEQEIRRIVREELSAPTAVRERVVAYVAGRPGVSRSEIERALGAESGPHIRSLVRSGRLRTLGGRKAARYYAR